MCYVRHVILNITILYSRIIANPITIEVRAALREPPPNMDNASTASRAVASQFT